MEVRRSHQHSCQGVCLLHRRPNGRRRPGWPLDHRVLDRSIKVSRGSARTWRPAHSPYTYAQACPGATCIYSPLRASCAHAGAEARRRDRMRGRVGGVTGGGATGGGTMGGEPTGLAARLAAAYCRRLRDWRRRDWWRRPATGDRHTLGAPPVTSCSRLSTPAAVPRSCCQSCRACLTLSHEACAGAGGVRQCTSASRDPDAARLLMLCTGVVLGHIWGMLM